MKTILFQGDSITDAGREFEVREPNNHQGMGSGYAALIASRLLAEFPQAGYKIYNRGISGNQVTYLADRWEADCLALQSDLVSILIGVNDTWHGM